jgi:DNA-binding NarL/FixJ family response regulator
VTPTGGKAPGKGAANRMAEADAHCDHAYMGTKVLIVDDHPSFRASARTLLEAEGFEVVGEADTGVAALRAAKELRPDLVLLDVQLPDFDGFEVAARLGQLDDPPQIVLTSSRDVSDYGRCIADSGARGFVPKAELSGSALTALLP